MMSDMFISYKTICETSISLRWRHDERDGVSNHQPHDYLLDRIFQHQRASNAENVPFDDVIMSYIYMLRDGDCF